MHRSVTLTASTCAGTTQHFRRHPFGLRHCCALLCMNKAQKKHGGARKRVNICHHYQPPDALRLWGTPSLTSSFAKGTNSSRVSRKLPCVSYFFIDAYAQTSESRVRCSSLASEEWKCARIAMQAS